MPMDRYDIKRFVKQISNEYISEKRIQQYIEILAKTVGSNPRAIIRIFNQFYLYLCIKSEIFKDEDKKTILFSILCMQSELEDLYNDIVAEDDDSIIKLLTEVRDSNSFESEKYNYESINEQNYDYLKYILGFVDNDDNLKDFVKILKDSAATSVDTRNKNNGADIVRNERIKQFVISEIDKYKSKNRFLSIGNSKSMFTSQTINDLFKSNEFTNESADIGNLCGYYIGFYGLKKNSWNTFTFSIGLKDIDKKNKVKNSLIALQSARDKLKSEGELDNIIKNAEDKGLKVSINFDDVIGKNTKNFLTVRFDDKFDDENELIKSIDSALDFIINFENELFSKISI